MKLLLGALEISLALSPVILLLLIVSPLLGKRYGAKLRCLVWLALAVRLLIPIGIPIEIKIPVRQPELWLTAPEWGAKAAEAPEAVLPANAENAAAAAASPVKLITVIWGLGAGLFLLYHLGAYLYTCRRLRRWSADIHNEEILRRFAEIKRELAVKRGVRLCRSEKTASPLLTGFLRHTIILPGKPLDGLQLDFMLRHELTHLKRGDLWYKLAVLLANAAHWYNPIVWLLAAQLNFDTELACDAEVLAGAGSVQRRAYGYTLLSFIEQGWRCKTPLTSRFLGGKKQLKQRFKNIADTSAKKRGAALLFAVMLVIALAGSAVYAAEPERKAGPYEQSVLDAAKLDMKATPEAPAASEEFIWPVKGEFRVVTSLDSYPGHTGIDILPKGAKTASLDSPDYAAIPVYASKSGAVVLAKTGHSGYGKHIIIDHGDGYQTLYAHNSELLVEAGDKVEQGRQIAKTGATGNAYGEYLHFEIRKEGKFLDPEELLPKPGADYYIWPVPTHHNISAAYGTRHNGADFHTGVDVVGNDVGGLDIDGATVIASNAGKVAAVSSSPESYGTYIILEHSNGISTLYAHLSETLVDVGDKVERGQEIGKAGSTGFATGPNLHIEVREDGKPVDPMKYLS